MDKFLRISKPASRGFSLAELLVVLAIMSILVGGTMMSLQSLRSSSLSATGNQIEGVFAMAQQNSLSKGDYTAIVIRTQGLGAYSAYCLLELPRQQDGSLAASWTELSPWKYLPNGVVFENVTNPAIDTFMKSSLDEATASPPLPVSLPTSYSLQGSAIDLTQAAQNVVQCYQPDGTLIGGQGLRLRLIEGTVNSTGSITYTGATASGSEVSYYDIYFVANTGATMIGRP